MTSYVRHKVIGTYDTDTYLCIFSKQYTLILKIKLMDTVLDTIL